MYVLVNKERLEYSVRQLWSKIKSVFATKEELRQAAAAQNLDGYTYSTTLKSVVAGSLSSASGYAAFAANNDTTASGTNAFSEGYRTQASGNQSHAEGNQAIASAPQAHAEGWGTQAANNGAHAEGDETIASGRYSHSEGESTLAQGDYSHAGGFHTIAASAKQTVIGKYNIPDTTGEFAFIVGNGTGDNARSNAFAITWNGKIVMWNNGARVEVNPAALAAALTGASVSAASDAQIDNVINGIIN